MTSVLLSLSGGKAPRRIIATGAVACSGMLIMYVCTPPATVPA